MEGDKVSDTPPSHHLHQTLSEAIDESCAFYMSIGVPYDEFWNGDYTHFKYYVNKFRVEQERANEHAWLQGLYIYDAVGTALANAFQAKSKPPVPYRKEPIQLYDRTEEEKKREQERIARDFRAQIDALGQRLAKKHRKDVKQDAGN